MWKKILVIIFGLAAIIAVALVYGARRWQAETTTMHSALEAARLPIRPKTYNANELIGLPAPVQRYFRAALTDGQANGRGCHASNTPARST